MVINFSNAYVCTECLHAVVNDDFTPIDMFLAPDKAEARKTEIEQGIADNGPFFCGDSDMDHEFSVHRCDCCGTAQAGARHHMRVTDNEEV